MLVISLVQCKAAEKFVFISVSSERLIGLREIFSADMMSHYFRGFEKTAVGGDIEQKQRGDHCNCCHLSFECLNGSRLQKGVGTTVGSYTQRQLETRGKGTGLIFETPSDGNW